MSISGNRYESLRDADDFPTPDEARELVAAWREESKEALFMEPPGHLVAVEEQIGEPVWARA